MTDIFPARFYIFPIPIPIPEACAEHEGGRGHGVWSEDSRGWKRGRTFRAWKKQESKESIKLIFKENVLFNDKKIIKSCKTQDLIIV